MKYFNMITNYGVETVDEINQDDYAKFKDYIKEVRRLKSEYRLAGMHVYLSQRSTIDWRNQ